MHRSSLYTAVCAPYVHHEVDKCALLAGSLRRVGTSLRDLSKRPFLLFYEEKEASMGL